MAMAAASLIPSAAIAAAVAMVIAAAASAAGAGAGAGAGSSKAMAAARIRKHASNSSHLNPAPITPYPAAPPPPPPSAADAAAGSRARRRGTIHGPDPGSNPGSSSSAIESGAAFSLYYGSGFKVLRNHLASDFTYLLLLHHASGDPSDDDESSYNYRGRDWEMNLSAFQYPINNYTIATSSAVGFLELLGCLGSLIKLPHHLLQSGIDPTCTTAIARPSSAQLSVQQAGADQLDHRQTAADHDHGGNGDDDDPSALDAVFGSIDSPANYLSDSNRSNFISFDASLDRGPLQRAEWIKFMAAFFDLEEQANAIYSEIASNYKCLSSSILSLLSAPASSSSKNLPMVGWLSYNRDLGVWTFSDTPYKLQFIADAGGANVGESVRTTAFNMSDARDVASFHTVSSALDVVIDETQAGDRFAYTVRSFLALAGLDVSASVPFVSNKRVWRYDKGTNNASDWSQQAVAQPQVVLRDLIEVLHPNMIEDRYEPAYFRNIAMDESIVNTTGSSCPHDLAAPSAKPTIIPCGVNIRKPP